jgi:hypothetical protein
MNKAAAVVTIHVALAICLLAGCNHRNDEGTYEEVMRVKSPDAKFKAVLFSYVGHVLGNNIHYLYTVPAGRKFDKNDAAFARSYLTVHCFESLILVWKESKMLEVQYREALIDEFRNCANLTDNPDVSHIIELRLAPQMASALPSDTTCRCLK